MKDKKIKITKKEITDFLDYLNTEYFKLHKTYEDFFWTSYMGDHSIDEKFKKANTKLTEFRSSQELLEQVDTMLTFTKGKEKERLGYWKNFFSVWQTPKDLLMLRDQIMDVETRIKTAQGNFEYGYVDPKTKDFVPASKLKLYSLISTNDDETIRKAAYEGIQSSAPAFVDEYVEYVKLLNAFAHKLGFEDFYAYKVFTEEGMTKKELFNIFDELYEKGKFAFEDIRALAKDNPKLKQPWNFSYMTSADFDKEEDPYFQFESALNVWTKSFANLGIDFRGSTITLDLLDRKGKHTNGFCHWPEIIHFKEGKRVPGRSGLTCNVIPGALGSGEEGIHTLFHEGGHAAHILNSDMQDVCVNNEYPPASTAWAETQSMFMDTIFSSIEWKHRYAKNKNGEPYPFDLFKRKLEKLHVFRPLGMMSIISVMNFEKEIFETKNLTKEKVIAIARKTRNKFSAFQTNSLNLLAISHIYSWSSTCSYHGYGLAELALTQWRSYFFKKYGYIVDNPNVGKEMMNVWKLGMSKTFPEFVQIATGKKLSAKPFIEGMMVSKDKIIRIAKQRIKKLEQVKQKNTHEIGVKIYLVHGKNKIADNLKGFDVMEKKYITWFQKQK